MATLRRSEELLAWARKVLRDERERLAALGVPGEVVLVGGASLPGALTVGDVDLHLRVPATAAFESVVSLLRASHAVASADAWAPTLAVFDVEAPVSAGLAATPVGSEHDVRFTRCWRLLAADPALLAQYNALKRSAAGTPAYAAVKSEFFDQLLRLWSDHPQGGNRTSGRRGAQPAGDDDGREYRRDDQGGSG